MDGSGRHSATSSSREDIRKAKIGGILVKLAAADNTFTPPLSFESAAPFWSKEEVSLVTANSTGGVDGAELGVAAGVLLELSATSHPGIFGIVSPVAHSVIARVHVLNW